MKKVLFTVIFFWITLSGAVTDHYGLTNDNERERFNQLSQELRCLVCQNQSLADSDAFLANDLRQTIVKMIHEGQSNEEIKTFMVKRYGDFILYRPSLSGVTYVLWAGPFIFLVIGFFILFRKKG